MMLVLSRFVKDEEHSYPSDTILIGEDISVKVVEARGGKVKLAIEAPKTVCVDRAEVRERRRKEQKSWERMFAANGIDEEAEQIALSVPSL